jgi:membrane protease subunit HflK
MRTAVVPTLVSTRLLRQLRQFPMPQLQPPLGASWLPWLAGAAVALWLGITMLHPVGADEQAIVETAGAWGPALGPGLAVSAPWPIGTARIENVTRLRHLAMPDGGITTPAMLTGDGMLVDVAYDVRWRIRDLRRHALGLADPDATLRLAAESAMRAAVARVDFGRLMGRDGSAAVALGADAARHLQVLLDRNQAGVAIDGIDVRRADPPARVAQAMQAVVAARDDAAIEATQAQSWSHQVIVHAQGEAGAFDKVYEQYRRAPAVTRRQMYYATMERVLAQSDKVIVDAPGTTATLPLGSLIAPSPSQSAGRASGAANGD